MQNYLILLLSVCFCLIVTGYDEDEWVNCENSPTKVICSEWCKRLNNYAKRYEEMQNHDKTGWRDMFYLSITLFVFTTILVFIWLQLRSSLRTNGEKFRRKIHRKKMEKMDMILKQDNKTNKNNSDDEDPESGEGYPVRIGILCKLKQNPRLARTYLEFKRKKAAEGLDHAVSSYSHHYDTIKLKGHNQDYEFLDDDPLPEIRRLGYDSMYLQDPISSVKEIKKTETFETRYSMRLLLLLVAVVLIAFIDGAPGKEFVLELEENKDCDAGEKTDRTVVINGRQTFGNKKYRIVEAYIYWTNSNGKVIGSAACNVPWSTKCVALEPSPTNAARRYLVVAVTLNKSSFEDQNIHYQYFDELFQLSKIPDPKKLPTANIHDLNNFLYIKSASYKTSKENLEFKGINCRENRAKSLISGHGYFITEFGGKGAWDNLYFLPLNGQYITTPN